MITSTIALTAPLLNEVLDALREVGRQDLVAKILGVRQKEVLTSAETARFLGISSPNTVKNWLAGGHFPGAFQTPGGHWRFPRAEVEEVKRRMEDLRERNFRGDLDLPDQDDEGEPPPL